MKVSLLLTNDIWIILFQLFSDGGKDLPAARVVLNEELIFSGKSKNTNYRHRPEKHARAIYFM